MVRIQLSRVNGDFGFEAKDAFGHIVRMDSTPESGGEDFGVRPMQMLLMGLGGCSGIDIVSILKKQRQTVTGFDMSIEGHREHGKEPSLWTNVHIVFELKGDIDPDKAKKPASSQWTNTALWQPPSAKDTPASPGASPSTEPTPTRPKQQCKHQ
ncbi:OsmC family protein [Puia sp. P3]|uniref:OsmC family protein n=1 Tax=Puia sp. P3 TaxID=3423952 RepID=UPI003D67396D